MNSNAADILDVLQSIDKNVKRIADATPCQLAPEIRPSQAYTRKEAAQVLGTSVWTVDRARMTGKLTDAEGLGPRHIRITGRSLMVFQIERVAVSCTKVQRL